MDGSLSNEAAIEFSCAFYQMIGFGRSLVDAVGVGCASLAPWIGAAEVPKLLVRGSVAELPPKERTSEANTRGDGPGAPRPSSEKGYRVCLVDPDAADWCRLSQLIKEPSRIDAESASALMKIARVEHTCESSERRCHKEAQAPITRRTAGSTIAIQQGFNRS
jgi:hypothetical protein